MLLNRQRANTFATAVLNGCFPKQRSNMRDCISTIHSALRWRQSFAPSLTWQRKRQNHLNEQCPFMIAHNWGSNVHSTEVLLLAQSGNATAVASCLLLGEERTWLGYARRSEFDPKPPSNVVPTGMKPLRFCWRMRPSSHHRACQAWAHAS